jgi:hypothetical protein
MTSDDGRYVRNRARWRIRAPKVSRLSPKKASPPVTSLAVATALVPRPASHGGRAPVRRSAVRVHPPPSRRAGERRRVPGAVGGSARAAISPSTLSTNVTSPESQAVI